jgi:glycosyltransferase involved in cell wall biosynthesis
MNITFISYPYPWPLNNGGNLRRFHLVKYLAAHYDVDLITLVPPAPGIDSPLELMCRSVRTIDTTRMITPQIRSQFSSFGPIRARIKNIFRSRRTSGPYLIEPVVSALRQVRKELRPDVTWVDRSYIAEAAAKAGFPNISVDIDDVLAVCMSRVTRMLGWHWSMPQQWLEVAKVAWYERNLPSRFPRVVVCKDDDRKFIGAHHCNVFVVPNGVELVPPVDPCLEEPQTMLFVAALDYDPNIDALEFFVRDILHRIRQRLPAARLITIGRGPDNRSLRYHDGSSVQIYGNVPSVEPYYEKASVVVCPIRLGSGTKLKMLEALARGKAVVGTSRAAEGLDIRPGIDFVLADEPASFASHCCELLIRADRRAELGREGRARIESRYEWEQIGQLAERALGLSPKRPHWALACHP